MENTVLVRLNISHEDYEKLIMETYLRWCMTFSIDYQNDLQKYLANAAINSYFLSELEKIETEFLNIMDGFDGAQDIKPADALKMFNICRLRLFRHFPKSLIAAANKLNIINNN